MEYSQLFAALIKEIRDALGISSLKAAQMFGTSQSTWSRFENGLSLPSIEQVKRFAEILGLEGRYSELLLAALRLADPSMQLAMPNRKHEFAIDFRRATIFQKLLCVWMNKMQQQDSLYFSLVPVVFQTDSYVSEVLSLRFLGEKISKQERDERIPFYQRSKSALRTFLLEKYQGVQRILISSHLFSDLWMSPTVAKEVLQSTIRVLNSHSYINCRLLKQKLDINVLISTFQTGITSQPVVKIVETESEYPPVYIASSCQEDVESWVREFESYWDNALTEQETLEVLKGKFYNLEATLESTRPKS